jgi:hypothetical protein
MIRNRSPAKQRRYLSARGRSFSWHFGRCPAVLGLKDARDDLLNGLASADQAA